MGDSGWGWDWTDCCTAKSNLYHLPPPGNAQPGPPEAPVATNLSGKAPYDERGAATRDAYNAHQIDGQGKQALDYSRYKQESYRPYSDKLNGSGLGMYSPQQGLQNPRPLSSTQTPLRTTPQNGQYASPPSMQNVGLGIAFQQKLNASDTPRPKLAVKSLAPGSPAHACGQIQVGDVLHSIGEVYVKGMSGTEIAPFILGPPGSEIRMAFERPMPDGSFQMLYVDLTRTWTRVGTAPPASQPVLLKPFGGP